MTQAAIAICLYLVIGLAFAIADARYGYGFLSRQEFVGIVLFWPLVAFILLAVVWMEWRSRRRRLRSNPNRSEQ